MSDSSFSSKKKPIIQTPRMNSIKRQPAPPKPVIKVKDRVVIKSTEK